MLYFFIKNDITFKNFQNTKKYMNHLLVVLHFFMKYLELDSSKVPESCTVVRAVKVWGRSKLGVGLMYM